MTNWSVDFHVHSIKSPDALNTEKQIIRRAREKGLDAVAIADHDWFDPARIKRLNRTSEIEFIPAEEVTTSVGHVLGYFLKEYVEPRSDPLDVIDAIHEQGGIAVLAHPFRHRMTYSGELWEAIDGVEIVNARSGNPADETSPNARTARALEELSVPVLGGSDAHFPWEIGRVVTGATVPEGATLQSAVMEGNTSPRLKTRTGFGTRLLSEVVWYGRLKGRLW